MGRARKPECDGIREDFLKQMEKHRMTIEHADGVHRCIFFGEPGNGNNHFRLITYPGGLLITGDHGSYSFSRLNDMFQFFRTDRSKDDNLRINLGYWSEKLTSQDWTGRHGGGAVEKFSHDLFREVIREEFKSARRSAMEDVTTFETEFSDFRKVWKKFAELWERIEDEVLCYGDDDESRSCIAANDFNEREEGTHIFRDFWEHSFHVYSYHFVWCCYAIAWGISKWDEHNSAPDAPIPDRFLTVV